MAQKTCGSGSGTLNEAIDIPSLGLLADVLGPDGLEGPEAAGRLDVADDADADHGRGLQDGDGLHHLLLVHLGAGPVHLAHNVSHTSLQNNTMLISAGTNTS